MSQDNRYGGPNPFKWGGADAFRYGEQEIAAPPAAPLPLSGIYFNGSTTKESDIKYGTLKIGDRHAGRATASFTVMDDGSTKSFVPNQPVLIREPVARAPIFGGFVESVEVIKVRPDGAREFMLNCKDNMWLADKRVVSKEYNGWRAGAIVNDIIDTILVEEGITDTKVELGPTVERFPAADMRCSDAIRKLAEENQMTFYIDANKKLWFTEREFRSAPFTLSSSDILWPEPGAARLHIRQPMYRNQQTILGGDVQTSSQTEVFVGDGERRAFPVGYRVHEAPTVEVDDGSTSGFVTRTIGVKGIDTGKDWYYDERDHILVQSSTATVVGNSTNTERVRFTYKGGSPLSFVASNATEIARNRVIECGGSTSATVPSGKVETVELDHQVKTTEEGTERANGRLARWAQAGRELQFKTARNGLEVGHVLTTNVPDLTGSTDVDFLVVEINASQSRCASTGTEIGELIYEVVAAGPSSDNASGLENFGSGMGTKQGYGEHFRPLHRNPLRLHPIRTSSTDPPALSPETPPDGVPGLTGWYRADLITGVGDGGTISQWNDSSGSGNTISSTGSTSFDDPTYKTNIINGLPTVLFDGSDDVLEAVGASNDNQLQNSHTVIAVAQLTGTTGNDMSVAGFTGFGTTINWMWKRLTSGFVSLRDSSTPDTYYDSTFTAAVGTPYVIAWRWAASPTAPPDTDPPLSIKIWVDGTEVGDFVSPGTTGTSFRFRVGKGGFASSFFKGHVAELATFKGAVLPADIDEVVNFFRNKYNI